jgi:polar amino acid transport system substrate-binding protein
MKNVLLVVIAVALALGLQFLLPKSNTLIAKHETAYERVMHTGVLRVAYGLWDPCVMRDPHTGKFSGIIYDLAQELGKLINVKVEYSLQTPWDSIGTVLHAQKADAHCAGIWATPARGRVLAFTNALFYSPTVAFARVGDNRFDNNLERINQPDITVALSDDDITTEIYRSEFPRAKKYELAQFAPEEELLLAVATKKADVAFNSPPRLHSFEKGYPNAVKIIPTAKPLRIYPDVFAVDIGEEELLHVLNTAIEQLQDSGAIDKLLAKYKTKYDMDFLIPVNRPYTWHPGSKI